MRRKVFASKYAQYYDIFYKNKPYKAEVEKIMKLVGGGYDYDKALDVACGTGGHAYWLADYFDLYVQDASKSMYDIAKKKMAEKLVQYCGVSRMESFNHRRKYGRIFALFAAIDYVRNLSKALKNLYKHLEPGGKLVFDFWNGEVVQKIFEYERRQVFDKKHFRNSYTILTPNKQEVLVDIVFGTIDKCMHEEGHVLKYYTITQVMKAMQKAGFKDIQITPLTDDLWNILVVGKK